MKVVFLDIDGVLNTDNLKGTGFFLRGKGKYLLKRGLSEIFAGL